MRGREPLNSGFYSYSDLQRRLRESSIERKIHGYLYPGRADGSSLAGTGFYGVCSQTMVREAALLHVAKYQRLSLVMWAALGCLGKRKLEGKLSTGRRRSSEAEEPGRIL